MTPMIQTPGREMSRAVESATRPSRSLAAAQMVEKDDVFQQVVSALRDHPERQEQGDE